MSGLFIGSAISTITTRGELPLPDHFCVTIQGRGARDDLFVGLHAADPCLLVHARDDIAADHARLEDACDWERSTCDVATRRRLGFVAPARMDGKGRIGIAPWMRSRRGVRQRALLVGMGRHFEVWNLDQLLQDGPADLILLATLHLKSTIEKEIRHEAAMPRLGTRRSTVRLGAPGVPLQSVPALQRRSDPVRGVAGL